TKENPDPIVGLDGLRAIRKLIRELPIVAIGGINLQNAKSVLDAGADSIAIISDLLSSQDIAQRMEVFNKI
ncbi:MAG: thiamine phosphate synthase, partial [Acidobacteria bacterium]